MMKGMREASNLPHGLCTGVVNRRKAKIQGPLFERALRVRVEKIIWQQRL